MAIFIYKAFDASGAKVNGHIEASSKDKALNSLKNEGLLPLQINEQKLNNRSLVGFKKKVSLADLEFFTAELSLLLDSGVRIDKGLDIIRKTKADPALASLISEMSSSLKKGMSLSDAVSQHSTVFDPLYVNLIQLGEASGQLPKIFNGLSTDLKFRRDLQRKIIQSLTYPAVIFSVCTLCVLFIFNFIVPQMSSLFADADNLPWYTELMLNISDWFQNYQTFLLAGMFAVGIGLATLWKRDEFQSRWQKLLLKLPIVKNTVLTAERIRFNSGLYLMLSAGVAIDKGLELSTGNIKNQYLRDEMDIVRGKVKRGGNLANSLQQTSLFPDFYVSLLEVGEESGNLAKIFDEIASRSRRDFEEWTQKLTTLLEPLLILLMGGIVGGVVVVMLLSMVSVNDIGI
ncbi:type II secretion system F family protein [Thalassotalea euphylliae]|uniref:Type II secretion system F family protein n=1 Tax=Thalassotalea euphylliae TaxID=1655234 RepID=A0A3E0UFH0_9GAMM|nr:type II secretion system F family protein [Thalassotalea euphylliae]REL34885.1 type II secretion system F family protein [Thalassotalea euphylliae]